MAVFAAGTSEGGECSTGAGLHGGSGAASQGSYCSCRRAFAWRRFSTFRAHLAATRPGARGCGAIKSARTGPAEWTVEEFAGE